jgi:hypothetical protein
MQRDFVAYVSATPYTVAQCLLQKLAWVRHGHAAFLFWTQFFNDTVALYGRVQIELVILLKDKACAWLK